MHPARLWKPLSEHRVQCRLCSHYCVIADAERGRCGVRMVKDDALHTLVYDQVAAIHLDPVEKKPLFHFYPGHMTFSLGTMGCNLACSFCQNYSLSQPPREGGGIQGQRITPQQLVDAAKANGARSISYTYSEPTVFFELMEETARLAHQAGLFNIIVSNGFMSPECLDALAPHIDAANIDLKAFTEAFYHDICQARLAPVLENLKTIRRLGWWLEVTTLLIPSANDSAEELQAMAAFIRDELGPQTPWHLSRFHPTWRMTDRGPTPLATLERAWGIGGQAGLQFVYVGNVPGHNGNNTYCQSCGQPLIQRQGFQIVAQKTTCPGCGTEPAGRWLEKS
ncbi:AmmeMemoRadiSam system radical SAM enzyme [Megalodesulfovibrio gigas]|uniref:Putative Radical SAM domain protein n=1 Tax=Megalodesulfovibrio gigas (strain ATCC 19364 / DSM 1382 / NCIMB 9332 / VKM B-1759) TaxID=1121448 RepID=T2GF34_MEGG1|nr:AmmeMemoRadiSam system radical SAM enzyme [Megalodesulfovibrio gigas]AGW14903.1 putative Radical SAM domain protein [Megalodesulfovibrio gigas DSM 1382 = ATCC 19364]